MNCEELKDFYELYAMGVAEEPERSEIRAHLGRGCEVCMREMKRARGVTAWLGAAVEPSAPSSQLRNRILASVGAPQRSFGWAWLGLAAAAAAIAISVYLNARERDAEQQLASLRREIRSQTIELTTLQEAMAILESTGTKEVSFGAGPRGRVFVHPTMGVLLMANNLPPAPAGKAYEMWLVPKGGNPVPAGMFQSDANGTAVYLRPGAVDVASTAAVAVTMEKEAGANTPTMPILIAAPLASAPQ